LLLLGAREGLSARLAVVLLLLLDVALALSRVGRLGAVAVHGLAHEVGTRTDLDWVRSR